ncbi:MAG: hypothetical protein P1V35_04265 [Planctomycetota bacterium]|nr:hypothetical protein [Planctomycetota bacterium]
MRGALKPFESLEIVDLKVGKKDFSVKYDKDKVNPDQIMAAIEKAGEKLKQTK